jgi:formamidopyrimidine-DNA glycosylase
MVEGHSVHRVAKMHRDRLVGKRFHASSPNGRFTEGAAAIDNKVFLRIEAVGKNLFAFFGSEENPVVVHVHFGMAGAWAVYNMDDEEVPAPTTTNRLRLASLDSKITADLSAMTVQHGGIELYDLKRSKLGQDPLRTDADVELLWQQVSASKKSIGALIMDQSCFTGPGNIYRAEILFKAQIHPDTPGKMLSRQEFDIIWHHTVSLLQRGYVTGSILTVDPEEAIKLGMPKLRRYIYNQKKCPRCSTSIRVWLIAARTCYACPSCQPVKSSMESVETQVCVPFVSHCARESMTDRLVKAGPSQLTVRELKDGLSSQLVPIPCGAKKKDLVHLWESCPQLQDIRSSEDAAADKYRAGESLSVEHIAELAPGQARQARVDRSRKRKSVSPPEDFQNMSVALLKRELTGLGVKYPAKAKKHELVELLQGAVEVSSVCAQSTPSKVKSEGSVVTP